ncbi:4-alpha-glucanotransferase (plasmid) [Tistrella mobilis]|uniref:4-alpha-glucanotransferase n=1 Tax=Tistrella mobilis TaxID=171437 RepID=UPI0035567565
MQALAAAAGIATSWTDAAGQGHSVTPDTLRALLAVLDLQANSPAQIRESLERAAALPPPRPDAAVGPRCFGLDAALGQPGRPPRAWGATAQLYGLRRSGDPGCGDTTALAGLARSLGKAGACCLGVSPVHALFGADPHRWSPYAPSSRLFLNELIIDPDDIAGPAETARALETLGLAARARAAAAAPLVDWPEVAAVKRAVIDHLLKAHGARLAADAGWQAFRAARGRPLDDHAVFEVLDARFREQGLTGGWPSWPQDFRDPRRSSVANMAKSAAEAVDRARLRQWLAFRGLAGAQRAATDAGMGVGLIADLAIGVDGSGAQAWSERAGGLNGAGILTGASIGAPPDLFNPLGQNWGLAAPSPRVMMETGCAGFRQMLDATLAAAGGIRIDHVLGLMRLWLIPDGASPAEGAYLRYPLAEMLDVVADVSQHRRAVVIGEDLGTVPDGFRAVLAARGLMGTRVLWFERDAAQDFRAPEAWEDGITATTTTHDLPTTAGWWQGLDIAWRERLSLFGPGETAALAQETRTRDRTRLWSAFTNAGTATGPEPAPDTPAPVIDAALDFLGRSRAPLVLAPLEDLVGLDDQPNLPGTIHEHPNWRRRMPAPLPGLVETPAVVRRVGRVKMGREKGVTRGR